MLDRIQRHWWMGILGGLLIAAAISAALAPRNRAGVASAETTFAPSPSPAKVEPEVYAALKDLRRQLSLTAPDLAALGCTQAQSTQVLATLLRWCSDNQAAIAAAERDELTARREARAVLRVINVGPATAADLSRFADAQSRLQQVMKQRSDLTIVASGQVSAVLTAGQAEAWATAKANSAAPGEYRYAGGVSAAQIARLQRAARASLGDRARLEEVETQVLEAAQLQRLREVRANQVLCARAVAEAEGSLLAMAPEDPEPAVAPPSPAQ